MRNHNDFKDHSVYICRDGNLEEVEKPRTGFGKQIITWQDGKPTHYETTMTKKI